MLIKNQQLKSAEAFEIRTLISQKSVSESAKIFETATWEEKGMSVLYGYVYSLVDDIAKTPGIGLSLDITYTAISQLMMALGYEFMIGMNSGYSVAKNIEIAEKTVAAFLYFLAANEHNVKINVEPDATSKGWTGLKITASAVMNKIDLLNSISGKISFKDKTLEIKVEDVLNAYKTLTGVDLKEYGIENATINLP